MNYYSHGHIFLWEAWNHLSPVATASWSSCSASCPPWLTRAWSRALWRSPPSSTTVSAPRKRPPPADAAAAFHLKNGVFCVTFPNPWLLFQSWKLSVCCDYRDYQFHIPSGYEISSSYWIYKYFALVTSETALQLLVLGPIQGRAKEMALSSENWA